MRETVNDAHRLQHMLDAIDKILQRDFDQWQIDIANDPILAYALVKLIEIIGKTIPIRIGMQLKGSDTS